MSTRLEDPFLTRSDYGNNNVNPVTSPPAEPQKNKSPSKHARLHSLDVVRGITMAVMILVDEIGAAYPHVNHSPWNNITLADFVMPWFLFMVGTSASFSLRKFKQNSESRWKGTRFVVVSIQSDAGAM